MRSLLSTFLPILLICATGCGPRGPETAPVAGTIAFAGKPVTEGTVMFWSTADGMLATGQIGPDGSYRLTAHPHGDGAVVGAHCVTVRSVRIIKPASTAKGRNELGPMGGEMEQLEWLVPQRYSDRQTSPLKAEVKSGPNTIDFDLPAERATP